MELGIDIEVVKKENTSTPTRKRDLYLITVSFFFANFSISLICLFCVVLVA